jgi:hypothetical protein
MLRLIRYKMVSVVKYFYESHFSEKKFSVEIIFRCLAAHTENYKYFLYFYSIILIFFKKIIFIHNIKNINKK